MFVGAEKIISVLNKQDENQRVLSVSRNYISKRQYNFVFVALAAALCVMFGERVCHCPFYSVLMGSFVICRSSRESSGLADE